MKIATDVTGYDLPSTMKKRTCSFGVGNRFKSTCEQRERSKSPPPGSYQLPSDFAKPGTANSAAKGHVYSFGIGRNHFDKVYNPARTVINDPDIPGPGTYSSKVKAIGTDGRKTKFQGRSKNMNEPENIVAKMNVPGPGHYGFGIETSKYGNYPLSTIENNKAAQWSPSERFTDTNRHNREKPGPGEYYPSDKSQGMYLLSNFKNYGTKVYRHDTAIKQKRKKLLDTPGPGTYMPPSDFGYLELYKYQGSPRTS